LRSLLTRAVSAVICFLRLPSAVLTDLASVATAADASSAVAGLILEGVLSSYFFFENFIRY